METQPSATLSTFPQLLPRETGWPHLPLFSGDEHVLVAVSALLGGAVDAAAGVDHVTDEVPVGRVSRGHDGEIQRQLKELLHRLRTGFRCSRSIRCVPAVFPLVGSGWAGGGGCLPTKLKSETHLQQCPVLADEPLGVVGPGLGCRFGKSWQRLGELCLLLQKNVLLLLLALSPDLQHARGGAVKQRPRGHDGLPVALLLLPARGCTERLSSASQDR